MRDFRDAKAMAQTIRAALAAKGVGITIAESLELIAKALGAADWNTLSAAIKTAEANKATPPPGPPPPNSNQAFDRIAMALGWSDWDAVIAALKVVRSDQPGRRPPGDRGAQLEPPAARTGTRFTAALEASLYRAVALAAERKHGYTTLEHLLLALVDDQDAAAVMTACGVDLAALQTRLLSYIDKDLVQLTQMGEPGDEPPPTAGFHRVIQRAVIHVQSAGRGEVTGANVLVAIFSERESHACAFLQAQRITRYDAVNFIAHGIRKGGAAA